MLLPITSNLAIANENIETKDTSLIVKIIYVDDDNIDGPWDGTIEHPHKNITYGILNATNEDTIYVFNGKYYENLTIRKNLKIKGENKTNTIIDGLYQKYVIHIVKDNIILENLTIRNSGGYKENSGIAIDSENNRIKNCIIYRTKTGIFVNETDNNEINNCIFYKNGEGIYFKSSQNGIIKNCCFCHNALGINIQDSNGIRILNCYTHTNGIGFFFNNSSNIEISKNAIYNNNDNQGGICLTFCKNIKIYNCNVYHNGFGIKTANSSHINISQTDICFNCVSCNYKGRVNFLHCSKASRRMNCMYIGENYFFCTFIHYNIRSTNHCFS